MSQRFRAAAELRGVYRTGGIAESYHTRLEGRTPVPAREQLEAFAAVTRRQWRIYLPPKRIHRRRFPLPAVIRNHARRSHSGAATLAGKPDRSRHVSGY